MTTMNTTFIAEALSVSYRKLGFEDWDGKLWAPAPKA